MLRRTVINNPLKPETPVYTCSRREFEIYSLADAGTARSHHFLVTIQTIAIYFSRNNGASNI